MARSSRRRSAQKPISRRITRACIRLAGIIFPVFHQGPVRRFHFRADLSEHKLPADSAGVDRRIQPVAARERRVQGALPGLGDFSLFPDGLCRWPGGHSRFYLLSLVLRSPVSFHRHARSDRRTLALVAFRRTGDLPRSVDSGGRFGLRTIAGGGSRQNPGGTTLLLGAWVVLEREICAAGPDSHPGHTGDRGNRLGSLACSDS